MQQTRPSDLSTAFGFFSGSCPENNVISYLQRHAEEFPARTALEWTTKDRVPDQVTAEILHHKMSYREFYQKTQCLAGGLKKLGIKKGDCVIIFLPMSVELYQSMFAVLQIGAIAVFLDSWARRTHLGASADTVNPKAMISFESAFQFCKEVPEIDSIGIKICAYSTSPVFHSLTELSNTEPWRELEAVEGEDTALITFTTGSSGRPKGANRTHQFLSAQHLALNRVIPYAASDKDLPAFPIFSLNNLAAGVPTVIPAVDIGSPTDKDPQTLTNQMRTCQVTCCTLSPSMLVEIARFCDRENIQLSFLRRVVTGGAPISNDDLRLFKKVAPSAQIWVLYGSTEVEPIAHIEANDILFPKNQEFREGNGVNVGHFDEGLEYKFLKINKGDIDFKGNTWSDLEVRPGEVGEIVVSGLHVCKSYYNYPEATKKTKIIDSENKVWHRTGDLGYLDEYKQVWLVGRVHNAIQRKGEWLFPVKAEIALKKLPFAKHVAYLGIPDAQLGERTFAVVSLREPTKDLSNKEKQVYQVLQEAGMPVDEVRIVDQVPMDPRHHSKVEYSVLREQLLRPI